MILAHLLKVRPDIRPTTPRPEYRTDITDKFDVTFLFGDLNFRLDISRLHADWLIANQGMQGILLCIAIY